MLDLFSHLFLCFSVSRFGSGDSAGVVQRERHSCLAWWILTGCWPRSLPTWRLFVAVKAPP